MPVIKDLTVSTPKIYQGFKKIGTNVMDSSAFVPAYCKVRPNSSVIFLQDLPSITTSFVG